jgi:hypothetical protein
MAAINGNRIHASVGIAVSTYAEKVNILLEESRTA